MNIVKYSLFLTSQHKTQSLPTFISIISSLDVLTRKNLNFTETFYRSPIVILLNSYLSIN